MPSLNIIKNKSIEVLTASAPFGYSAELRRKFPYFILRKETLEKCLADYKKK